MGGTKHLTYRIVHHLYENSGQNLTRLALELGTHGLDVEEIMARVRIRGENTFRPFQRLVSPRSDGTFRVKRVNGGQVSRPLWLRAWWLP